MRAATSTPAFCRTSVARLLLSERYQFGPIHGQLYAVVSQHQSFLSLAFEEALLHERCSTVYAGKVCVLWRNYLATPSNWS